MDVHDKETRSYNMSHIRAGKTKPEEIVAKYLFSAGFRYRRNVKNLPGTPDIVLKKYKTVIFVNGCFWHMHEGCKYFVWPQVKKMQSSPHFVLRKAAQPPFVFESKNTREKEENFVRNAGNIQRGIYAV